MGRTLFGIDLDESPFGGLIEALLDEEDLERLEARPDGGSAPGKTGGNDDATGSEDATWGEDATGSDGGRGDGTASDRTPGPQGDDDAETPSPGGEDDAETPSPGGEDAGATGAGSLGGSSSLDGGSEDRTDEEPVGVADGDGAGRFSVFGSGLRKAALAVAGLAVLAVVVMIVVRRYGDRVAAALPDRLRPGDDAGEAVDESGSGGPVTTDRETATDARRGRDGPTAGSEEPGEGRDDERGAVGPADDDLGALVALAFLALVAALVRKAVEEPPGDPFGDED